MKKYVLFDKIRNVVRCFVGLVDLKRIVIDDTDLRKAFFIACEVIDNAPWKDHQKVFCKKACLLLASKLANDTVYSPYVYLIMYKIRNDPDIFNDHDKIKGMELD